MKRLLLTAAATFCLALAAAAPAAGFGLKNLEFTIAPAGGAATAQAGSHPASVTTNFAVTTEPNPNPTPETEFEVPQGALKSISVHTAAGLVGNPTAVPRCPSSDFYDPTGAGTKCPNASAVGIVDSQIEEPGEEGAFTSAVYNLEPSPGAVATIGFWTTIVPYTFDLVVNPNPPYNVIARPRNVPEVVYLYSSKVTLWGVPANSAHDAERGKCAKEGGTSSCPVSLSEKPFLTLPTRCDAPLSTTFQAESWEGESFQETIHTAEGLSGCNKVKFTPTITSTPTTSQASSPTGLEFSLDFNDEGISSPTGTAQSEIKKAVVTLPQGVTTNPSIASGLSACSFAQYDELETIDSTPGTGCPESSKVGSVEVESPLLEGELIRGSIYVARQGDRPFSNLLTIYMVIKDPELGLLIKQAGKVEPDSSTGQLRTTFDELPQLPFSHFRLHFRSGERAPLITPSTCGTYTTTAELYPWADPTTPRSVSSSFQVNGGANGAACATNAAELPNKPSLSAGTVDPIAGAYSPFVFKVSREDGSQEFSSISSTLPKGLLGRLAGIPYCSDAQIVQAESRSAEGQGALELASPSCSAASEVGTVTVGSGAGSQPYYVTGHAYLAGPYKGAPLSLEIITPAIAGPFDLGVVAVRTALYVDETSAQVTAVSDRIPTILHGLPLVVRSISLNLNRSNFTLNPTNCEAKAVEGSVTSTLGQVASLSQRFRVGSCAALGFKPKLSIRLRGQTKRSGNPALKAVLTPPSGEAGIASVTTVLPESEFIDNSHVNNPCTRVQFNADACPSKSILGVAKAWSPLLDKPLEGRVYFRSNGGERELPDLVAALHGQIDVTLVGFIDSVRRKGSEISRIRTRFKNLPDAPVSRFVLELSGGKKGLLENSANLCKGTRKANVKMSGQNGRAHDTQPVVKVDCKKKQQGKARGKNANGKRQG